MPHNEAVVDIECMSTAKDAAIVAIGAVRFDRYNYTLGERFYRVVNLKSAQRAGGKIDAETVMWWLQQSEAARAELTGDNSVLIDVALKEFSEFLRSTPLEGLWGNGSDFDNVILESAYQRSNKTPAWSYKINRCYRTVASMYPQISKGQAVVAHNAIDDAVVQAEHLCKIFSYRDKLENFFRKNA